MADITIQAEKDKTSICKAKAKKTNTLTHLKTSSRAQLLCCNEASQYLSPRLTAMLVLFLLLVILTSFF